MRRGAHGVVLFSVLPRDGVAPVPGSKRVAAEYARHGFGLVEMRGATAEEVAASRSSWAKCLRAGKDRPTTLLRLRSAS